MSDKNSFVPVQPGDLGGSCQSRAASRTLGTQSFSSGVPNQPVIVAGSCALPAGGTKTAQGPQYVMTIKNSGASEGATCILRDDDFTLLQDDDSTTLCIDQL